MRVSNGLNAYVRHAKRQYDPLPSVPPPPLMCLTGSRLEDLLEKSHVAHSFGGGMNQKRRRTHLDAVLAGVSPEEEAASDGAAAAAAAT